MKRVIVSLFIVFAFIVGSIGVAVAQDAKKAPSPAQQAQQERMKSCNKDATAKGLKGDARKDFMKSCLSGKAGASEPAAKKMTQQDKMKACNKEATAKALKGDDRKKFMSDCLKK